jgi:hypothetical protein
MHMWSYLVLVPHFGAVIDGYNYYKSVISIYKHVNDRYVIIQYRFDKYYEVPCLPYLKINPQLS